LSRLISAPKARFLEERAIERAVHHHECDSGLVGGWPHFYPFKGKPGFEERLNEITKQLGIGFFVVSIVVALLMNKV
jgi:hypothetical protein